MKDRKKRRMGLVIGYVGTEYFGLQKSTSQDVDIRTVESVLEKVRQSRLGATCLWEGLGDFCGHAR